jgi:anti-anti-sigma factor
MALDLRLTTLSLPHDAYVCTLDGDFDSYTTATVKDELERLEALGAEQIIVDLVAVRFMDSAALGLLLSTASRLRGQGGEVAVVVDDPRILRVLEVTGSGTRLTIENSLAKAVNGLERDAAD